MHPVAFFPRKLGLSEKNYDVGDRELLVIKSALEEWQYLLEGAAHPILIFTDHKNIEYLRTAKLFRPRQVRWALFFHVLIFTLLTGWDPRILNLMPCPVCSRKLKPHLRLTLFFKLEMFFSYPNWFYVPDSSGISGNLFTPTYWSSGKRGTLLAWELNIRAPGSSYNHFTDLSRLSLGWSFRGSKNNRSSSKVLLVA